MWSVPLPSTLPRHFFSSNSKTLGHRKPNCLQMSSWMYFKVKCLLVLARIFFLGFFKVPEELWSYIILGKREAWGDGRNLLSLQSWTSPTELWSKRLHIHWQNSEKNDRNVWENMFQISLWLQQYFCQDFKSQNCTCILHMFLLGSISPRMKDLLPLKTKH